MSNNKNQHFVPQFYFRFFSKNDSRIALLQKKTGNIIYSAPISGQCSKNFFYDSVENEKYLSSLEQCIRKILNELANIEDTAQLEKLISNESKYTDIILSITLQRLRVPSEAQKLMQYKEAVVLSTLRLMSDANMLPEPPVGISIDDIKVNIDPKHSVISLIKSIAPSFLFLLRDLNFYLLINKSKIPFSFSDSPVIFHSMLDTKIIGAASHGLIVLYPISSSVQIMLVDSSAYKIKAYKTRIIQIGKSDVIRLNELQIVYADSNIYCHQTGIGQIKKIWENINIEPTDKSSRVTTMQHSSRYLISFNNIIENYRLELSFIRLRDKISPRPLIRKTVSLAELKDFEKGITTACKKI